VALLGLLQALSEGIKIDTAILVGSFRDPLGREDLKGLFEESFDFSKIHTRARRFVFLHSDDDPFCPLEGARYLSEHVGGELIIIHGAKHFSLGTGGSQFKELPQILKILDGTI
jgi:predicted alpha/beta hydrolase family esterase